LIQYQSDSIEILKGIGTSIKYIHEERYLNEDVSLIAELFWVLYEFHRRWRFESLVESIFIHLKVWKII
jgi:hypothetical protein